MKVMTFTLLAGICLLIVLGRPQLQDQTYSEREEIQEEQEREEAEILPEEELVQIDDMMFRVIHHIDRVEDEPIADIIWLKRAAEVALKNGSPYFRILEQNATKEFSREHNMELTLIEGIIVLDPDPMNAEYDAYVISELELDPFER